MTKLPPKQINKVLEFSSLPQQQKNLLLKFLAAQDINFAAPTSDKNGRYTTMIKIKNPHTKTKPFTPKSPSKLDQQQARPKSINSTKHTGYPASKNWKNKVKIPKGKDYVQINRDMIPEMEFKIKLKKSEIEFLDCFKKLKIENFKKSVLEKKSQVQKNVDPLNADQQKQILNSNIEQILGNLFKDAQIESTNALIETMQSFYEDSYAHNSLNQSMNGSYYDQQSTLKQLDLSDDLKNDVSGLIQSFRAHEITVSNDKNHKNVNRNKRSKSRSKSKKNNYSLDKNRKSIDFNNFNDKFEEQIVIPYYDSEYGPDFERYEQE